MFRLDVIKDKSKKPLVRWRDVNAPNYYDNNLGGGGSDDHDFFDHLAYVRVSWSNGQKFLTMTMAKISKLPWSNGQNWPFLTMAINKI